MIEIIKNIRLRLKKRPKLKLILKVASILYSSIVIFSLLMISFITDTLSELVKYFDSMTILVVTLLILEFYNSVGIGLFFGEYLVEINELSRKTSGVNKIKESRVVKLIMLFQMFYLIPGIIIIVLGSVIFFFLLIILIILIFKIFVFISISLIILFFAL